MASSFSAEKLPILFRQSLPTTYRSNHPRSPVTSSTKAANNKNNNNNCSGNLLVSSMESKGNSNHSEESDTLVRNTTAIIGKKKSSAAVHHRLPNNITIGDHQRSIDKSISDDSSSSSSSHSSSTPSRKRRQEEQSDILGTITTNSAAAGGAAEEADFDNHNPTSTITTTTMGHCCNHINPLINCLLRQTVLADKLSNHHPILHIISLNGKYTALAILTTYIILITIFWIPCYILSQLFTELGVYMLLLTCVVYSARCLLRLLAFPGTNVRVYGEIEIEFARYSCKMLEDGAVDAVNDFCKCLLSCCTSTDNDTTKKKKEKSSRILANNDDGWSATDIPATYKRLKVYRDRVLGVYWQVLHCLFEENGQGLAATAAAAAAAAAAQPNISSGVFYRLGGGCCERRDGSTTKSELGVMESTEKGSTTMIEANSASASIMHKTPYGNNPLQGDIGNMTNLTPKAKSDGRALYHILNSILNDLSTLEASLSNNILRNIENNNEAAQQLQTVSISEESQNLAIRLMVQMNALKALVKSIRPPKASKSPFPSSAHDNGENEQESEYDDEDSDVGAEAVRHHLEEQAPSSSPTTMGMIRSSFQAFFDMLDPKPHKYIFGLDVIRGSVLARYRGARQFWVKRGGGKKACGGDGKIDVIVIPSLTNTDSEIKLPLSPRDGRSPLKTAERNGRKAVLYCNPNAGLSEVAVGLSLLSGNVDDAVSNQSKDPSQRSWTEYYTENGYDVYLFNYAGYGRSYGGCYCNESSSEFAPGFFGAIKRILFSTFIGFTPSSETLKADATDVARHIVENIGVDQLIIHGESIGGMAAAGAARALTSGSAVGEKSDIIPLLICDRTFCNLNAVAQRLVGGWTGNAIKLLTPNWSTDVCGDFLATTCAKIVANDASDEIIHDHSSLKSGITFAKELMRGATTHVGWMIKPPLQYRMADLTSQALPAKNPPTWPSDKHITFVEAFHFAACVRRIGKLATAAKKHAADELSLDEEGIELSYVSDESSTKSTLGTFSQLRNTTPTSSAVIQMWSKLSCCDGLCGAPLGVSVKEGMDVTISWLTSALVFGSHVLAENAEKRLHRRKSDLSTDFISGSFQIEDFDSRPESHDEHALGIHPIPIPAVLSSLKEMISENRIPEVENEIEYIIGCLTYVVSRLTSKENGIAATRKRRFETNCVEDAAVGCFLNLHCGHNNQYSTEERDQLMSLIRRCCGDIV